LHIQSVYAALTVGQNEDPLAIDIRALRQQLDRAGQLGGMTLHTDVAGQALHVLLGVRSRGTLVIAQRKIAVGGQGLGEQGGAAIAARQERRIPVAIGRPTAGNKHNRWEGTFAERVRQGGVNGDTVQHP
jgi:hypothetical protein